MEYFLEKQILYLMHEISCRKDINRMAKKIISETSEYIIDETTGECKLKRSCQTALLGTEEHFVKFYKAGLEYLVDMPASCMKVFFLLVCNLSYVDHKIDGIDEYGMLIYLNPEIKKGMAQRLGFQNVRSLDNVIQELIKANVLERVAQGIYRPNPYIVSRGAWKEVAVLREGFFPLADGDTFKTVCAKKDAVKAQAKENEASRQAV